MTIDEAITRFKHNAEYQRTHGDLQGCLYFRQLAEWLEQLQEIQEIIKSWKDGTIEEKDSVYAFHKICEVVEE
jgi:hypothetical protein